MTLNHRKSGIDSKSGASLQIKTKQIFDNKKRLQKSSQATFISNRAAYSNDYLLPELFRRIVWFSVST